MVVAVDACVDATTIFVAHVDGTFVVIVAILGQVETMSAFAKVAGTHISILASYGSVDASFHFIALVNGTWIVVITTQRGENTSSLGIASVSSASVSVIAIDRGVNASLGCTCVFCAFVVVIARHVCAWLAATSGNGSENASFDLVARIGGARVVVSAQNGAVYASN